MQGRRIPPPTSPWEAGKCPFRPGDYWKDADDGWHGVTPNGLLAWLKKHHVEEHSDGTITVEAGPWGSNSILVGDGRGRGDGVSWHGYIVNGHWNVIP